MRLELYRDPACLHIGKRGTSGFGGAGIQIPAGTIEPGENPRDSVMREAEVETGLSGISRVRFLARDTRDMRFCVADELQHRWFFHLSVAGPIKEAWRHGEHSEVGSLIHPFGFFWADVRTIPGLVAGYDGKLNLLIESMNARK